MTYIVTNVTDTKINPYTVTINDLPGGPIPFKPSEAKDLELFFTRNQLNDSRDIKIKLDRGDITVDTMGTNPTIRWHVDAALSTGPITMGAITIKDGTTLGDATVMNNLTIPPFPTDNALLTYIGNPFLVINDGGGSITIDTGGVAIEVFATGLDIRHLNASIDSITSFLVDENGNPFTLINPLAVEISNEIDVVPKKGIPKHFIGTVNTTPAVISTPTPTTAILVHNPPTNNKTDILEVSFDNGAKWHQLWRKDRLSIETEISSFKIRSNNLSIDYQILVTVK